MRRIITVLILIVLAMTGQGEELDPPENQRDVIAIMADRIDVPVIVTDLAYENGFAWETTNGSLVIYLDEQIFYNSYQTEEKKVHKTLMHVYGMPIVTPDLIANDIGYDRYPELVMTHEVGHIKKYRYEDKQEQCIKSECSNETDQWDEIVENATSNGWELPTWYSKKDNSELFAECYTLLEYGYTEWLTPEIIDYIVEVNSNWK